MDRFWLLTWTTYGTWLPGDRRGFVSPLRDETGVEVLHNIPGTPFDADIVALREYSKSQMKGTPIKLNRQQADKVFVQFDETAGYRHWSMCAAAIMVTHVHIVGGVPGDPRPSVILGTFKSYASRKLNQHWDKPINGTWWTESESKRKLPNEEAVTPAVRYVKNQPNPLLVWVAEQYRIR